MCTSTRPVSSVPFVLSMNRIACEILIFHVVPPPATKLRQDVLHLTEQRTNVPSTIAATAQQNSPHTQVLSVHMSCCCEHQNKLMFTEKNLHSAAPQTRVKHIQHVNMGSTPAASTHVYWMRDHCHRRRPGNIEASTHSNSKVDRTFCAQHKRCLNGICQRETLSRYRTHVTLDAFGAVPGSYYTRWQESIGGDRLLTSLPPEHPIQCRALCVRTRCCMFPAARAVKHAG